MQETRGTEYGEKWFKFGHTTVGLLINCRGHRLRVGPGLSVVSNPAGSGRTDTRSVVVLITLAGNGCTRQKEGAVNELMTC